MGSQQMAALVGEGTTSVSQAKKALKLAIREYKHSISREYLDDKKKGIVGRKMYRDKWGHDELSAEVQWVGLNTQLIVICEYFLRYLDAHNLAQTKKHFKKLWDAKVKDKHMREVNEHQKKLFYRLNESIEGALKP